MSCPSNKNKRKCVKKTVTVCKPKKKKNIIIKKKIVKISCPPSKVIVKPVQGPPGPQGPQGPQGIPGPAGPQGPAGGISSFAFLCSTEEQNVSAAPFPGGQGEAVTFNDSTISSTAVTFAPPTSVVINENGFYHISWEVFPVAGNSAFGLFFDPDGAGPGVASLVPCSNYGSGAGNNPYQGQVVTALTAGGVLTLNRIDNMGNQVLQNTIGGGTPTVSASLLIEKLS